MSLQAGSLIQAAGAGSDQPPSEPEAHTAPTGRSLGSHVDREASERRVSAMWWATELRFRELVERQARATRLLSEDLQRCQESNHLLEEEKDLLWRAIAGLHERMAFAEGLLRLRAASGFDSPLLGKASPPLLQEAAAKYPPLPDFPLLEETAEKEAEEAPAPPQAAAAPPPADAPLKSGMLDDKWSCQATAKFSLADFVDPCPSPPRRLVREGPAAALRAATPGRSPTKSQHMLLTPPRTPQSQRGSKARLGTSTPMKSPAVPASPIVLCEDGGCKFGFTLRLADGVALGLELSYRESGADNALQVLAIKPGGAIDSWNRLCVGGPSAGKEPVAVGDRVVAINGMQEPEAMLQECRTKQLLRLSVVRGERDCEPPCESAAGDAAGGLCGILPAPTPMPRCGPHRPSEPTGATPESALVAHV
uniref:PDZ domain-containing protein n=1 Tax=Alexandrium monilatum TaxID=311494 RepID=A0A7S4Q6E1_9DINO|mmetsp:Transcript_88692/g.264626  ORF Transcript_88692/g.264626 Transcript_88692/m.264626 type:complete len:422 (+) Transcript_88692:130-1395(+)